MWKSIQIAIILGMVLSINVACSSDQEESRMEIQQEQQQQQMQEQVNQQQARQQQQPPADDIVEDELRQFAEGMQQIRSINEDTQEEMLSALEESGLDLQQYREMSQKVQSPDAQEDVTAQERQQLQQANQTLQQISQEAEQKQSEIIQNSGLEPERFQEIFVAVRQDSGLLAQYQELVEEME